jgi:phosphate uptake regulator
MAELSLKEEIAKILEEHFDTRCLEELPNGEFKPVNLTDKATKDIIKLMLAKVDKALLTDFETIANDVINHAEDIKKNYRHISYALVEAGAKAQLQAVKDILEGE